MDRMGIIEGLGSLLETLVDVVARTSAASAQQEQQQLVDRRVIGLGGVEPLASPRPRRKAKKPCGPCGDKKGV